MNEHDFARLEAALPTAEQLHGLSDQQVVAEMASALDDTDLLVRFAAARAEALFIEAVLAVPELAALATLTRSRPPLLLLVVGRKIVALREAYGRVVFPPPPKVAGRPLIGAREAMEAARIGRHLARFHAPSTSVEERWIALNADPRGLRGPRTQGQLLSVFTHAGRRVNRLMADRVSVKTMRHSWAIWALNLWRAARNTWWPEQSLDGLVFDVEWEAVPGGYAERASASYSEEERALGSTDRLWEDTQRYGSRQRLSAGTASVPTIVRVRGAVHGHEVESDFHEATVSSSDLHLDLDVDELVDLSHHDLAELLRSQGVPSEAARAVTEEIWRQLLALGRVR